MEIGEKEGEREGFLFCEIGDAVVAFFVFFGWGVGVEVMLVAVLSERVIFLFNMCLFPVRCACMFNPIFASSPRIISMMLRKYVGEFYTWKAFSSSTSQTLPPTSSS